MSKEGDKPLFVKSAVRSFVNENGCNMSGDVLKGGTLNNQIKKLLTLAMERTKKAKRKTVMAQDFRGLIKSE